MPNCICSAMWSTLGPGSMPLNENTNRTFMLMSILV